MIYSATPAARTRFIVDISENEEQFVNLWYLVHLTFEINLIDILERPNMGVGWITNFPESEAENRIHKPGRCSHKDFVAANKMSRRHGRKCCPCCLFTLHHPCPLTNADIMRIQNPYNHFWNTHII